MRRRPAVVGTLVLVLAVLLGGCALSWAEDVTFAEGLALAFWTASTLGFGEGPSSPAGTLLVAAIFASAVLGYFHLLAAAFEIAMRRVEGDRLRRARLTTDEAAKHLVGQLNRN